MELQNNGFISRVQCAEVRYLTYSTLHSPYIINKQLTITLMLLFLGMVPNDT